MFGVRCPFDARRLAQAAIDDNVVREPRGHIGGERHFALAANGRTSGERGESREAKAGWGERVRRLGDEHSGN